MDYFRALLKWLCSNILWDGLKALMGAPTQKKAGAVSLFAWAWAWFVELPPFAQFIVICITALVSSAIFALIGMGIGGIRNRKNDSHTNRTLAPIIFSHPESETSSHEVGWKVPILNSSATTIARNAIADVWLVTGERYVVRWQVAGGKGVQMIDIPAGESRHIHLAYRGRNLVPTDLQPGKYLCWLTDDRFYFLGNKDTLGYPKSLEYEFHIRVRGDNISEQQSPQYILSVPRQDEDNSGFTLRIK